MKDFFYKYSNREDLTAIRTTKEVISYKQLFELAKEISGYLIQNHFTSQKYVPIIASNSAEFIILIISLWNAGFVPVPLNTRWTEKEIELVLKRNQFDVIFFEKNFEYKINHLDIKKFSINNLQSYKSNKTENIDYDESVVIFTSGTTDIPKGVVHTFTSLSNSILNSKEILNQNISDRWLASLPFYHIGGFQIICRALSSGCEIIISDDLDNNSIINCINKFNPTHISLVSTQLRRLIDSNVRLNPALKLTLIGGGFSDDELIIRSDKLGWKPYRVYGSSETASFVTAANANEIKSKPRTVGKPMKNVLIKISNDNEVLISTESLFKYYLNDTDETNIKNKNGFYSSGDIGFIDGDDYLFIEARRHDLIITGGENVNPYEVENELIKISEIKEACVFPLQDAQWGQIVAAALVLKSEINQEKIECDLKKNLSSYKIPKKFFFVDEIPKTSLGKFERNKIREMFA
jgi:O-succinylbenzoic acid--CoA ligase